MRDDYARSISRSLQIIAEELVKMNNKQLEQRKEEKRKATK